MSEPPPLSDEERDELVAYLDGELDEEAARGVEARLNRDSRLRAEAETLRATWDLLDYLPRPEPSPSFTHRTLDRVSALRSVSRPVARRTWVSQIVERPVASALTGAGWAAALAAFAIIGFGGAGALLSRHPTDEDLVRDLRIIEKKRVYEKVDDIEFLHRLAHPDLFGDDGTGG